MRVHLPDGMVLQASFQPLEPLQKLKASARGPLLSSKEPAVCL